MNCVANCVLISLKKKKRYLIENLENGVMANLFFVFLIILDQKNIIHKPSELLNQFENRIRFIVVAHMHYTITNNLPCIDINNTKIVLIIN